MKQCRAGHGISSEGGEMLLTALEPTANVGSSDVVYADS